MTSEMEKYLEWTFSQYDRLKEALFLRLVDCWPRFELYNHFERFVILNLVVIGIYLLLSFFAEFTLKGFTAKLFKMIYDLPPIRNYILREKDKIFEKVLS